MTRPAGRTAWQIIALIAVSLVMFLLRAGTLPLMDPDESRCALITAEMQRTGDWIVPHLKGVVYPDKPAAFFWLAAAAEKLTGNAELGGRLVSALAAVAAVLVTYLFASRLFGATAGLLAGLILATSGEFLFIARWFRMDMAFAAAMWAALWWFWRHENRFAADAGKGYRRQGWLGFYFFCAVATLFKGPAGLVLPALVIISYLVATRQARRIAEFLFVPGIGLYLLVAAPWYVAISLREPNYLYDFFIRQNLYRYVGGDTLGHHWPGILYVPILLAGLLPWTVYLLAVIKKYFPRRLAHLADRRADTMLWLTAFVTVLFFSLSSTKLASYIVPAFPPLAILTGRLIGEWLENRSPDKAVENAGRALAAILLTMLLLSVGLEIYLESIDLWIVVPVICIIAAGWQMIKAVRSGQRSRFILWAFAGVIVIMLFLFGHTAEAVYELKSTRILARQVPADVAGRCRICFFPQEELSFIFYTSSSKTEKFSDSSPEDIKQLAGLMDSGCCVYCLVTGRDRLEHLQKICDCPLYILGRNGERWLVANRPAADSTQNMQNRQK